MAKVIASRSLRFRGEGDFVHQVVPGALPQEFPAQLLDTEHFKAAEQSGWIRLVKDAPGEVSAETYLSVLGADEIFAELQRRGVMPTQADLEPVTLDAFSDDQLADEVSKRLGVSAEDGRRHFAERRQELAEEEAYRKSSGIDGNAGDWTESGQDATGFPVPKGSAEDVTAPKDAKGKGAKTPPAK
jgi:hypothetical protein